MLGCDGQARRLQEELEAQKDCAELDDWQLMCLEYVYIDIYCFYVITITVTATNYHYYYCYYYYYY